jgi:hypothetical protein
MFAPPVAKPKAKAAGTLSAGREVPPIVHEVLRPEGRSFDAGTRAYLDQASAPTVSWNFAAIPVYSPSSVANSSIYRHPFTAKLRAIVKGSQSDALSADRQTPPAESEPQIRQSDVPKPEESKLQRNDGESISVPDGWLPSVSGEQTDSITSHLNYTSSIDNTGPPPSDFGLTKYDFVPDNFKYTHHPATPGTPAGPGSAGTPPTPANYEVTGDIRGVITYQVNSMGRTNIASDSDPSITQRNYPNIVADLTPPTAPVVHNGRQFMKNQPFRDQYWARDLTIRHEILHSKEDAGFGGQGVQAAQTWLDTRTANSEQQLFALLSEIIRIIGRTVTAGRAAPADEQRAYDDGAPLYRARVQGIERNGDANGYAPRPAPAPAPKPPAPAPQPPGPAPTPAGLTSAAAAGSRFGHSFGDIAVWGAQQISETSVKNETALPTSQTDAGPPTPTHRAPSPPAPAPAGPAAPRCTISSRTVDTAPDRTADTRTVVGVNEIVEVSASAPSRWSATAGPISGTGASIFWLSPASSAKPVSCSVTATPATGSPCSISFHVIPPRERKMTKMTDRAYIAGRAGSGFEATALILPLNVSFSGIQVREETVAGEATGYYKDVLGWDKGMHPTGKWNRVDATNNNIKDTIGTNPPGTPGPFGIGTFYWPIPLTWKTPNDPPTFRFGTADQIQVMLDSSGAEITSKEGAERARTP